MVLAAAAVVRKDWAGAPQSIECSEIAQVPPLPVDVLAVAVAVGAGADSGAADAGLVVGN